MSCDHLLLSHSPPLASASVTTDVSSAGGILGFSAADSPPVWARLAEGTRMEVANPACVRVGSSTFSIGMTFSCG